MVSCFALFVENQLHLSGLMKGASINSKGVQTFLSGSFENAV